ncbi:hypothetical protein ACROYT_G021454 [Oculina patagonica]
MGRPFPALSLLFVTVLWGGWLHCSTVADCHRLCRRLYFVTKIDGHALQGHVFKNLSLFVVPEMRSVCTHECLMEPVCVSMNIGPPIKDEFICELSYSDHLLHPNDVKPREGFMYLGTENPCFHNPCHHDSCCLNGFTDKGYLCECQAGYTGKQCENDIDECAMKIDNCSQNAKCNNTEGSFNCSCKPGFSGDGINCADIDECAMKIDNCSQNAMCNNTEGSFNCSCKPGFSGDGINCADIDECTMKIDNCSENAMCNNTEGSFNCSCKPGFLGDGINCADIDECAMKIDNCSQNAMCNNTEGSFNCSCKPGFFGDGINCADIDECAMKIDNCSENAKCNNTEGSFNCTCKPGFSGDGIYCTDVDECAMKIDNCSQNAKCNNTEGSFNCSCKPGFSGDGINCADIDECAMKIDNCSQNAMCNNTEGSFNCSCKPGFFGDGINCADIDECAMKIDNCSENAKCNNTEGSFNCTCKPGFSGDGIYCTGGRNMEEHNKTLEAVLQRAVEFGVKFNPDKCQFGVEEIEFYGHKFTKDGLKLDPEKIRAVKESSPPESKEAARLPRYASLTAPLRKLTHKDAKFNWGAEENEAFKKLKASITSESTVTYFNPAKPIVVRVEASYHEGPSA